MAAKAIYAFAEPMASSNCCSLKMKQIYESSQRMTFCKNPEILPFVQFPLQSYEFNEFMLFP